MAGLIWAIIVVLFVFWLLGFTLHIAGGFIHLLLVIAVVLLIFNIVTGRGADVGGPLMEHPLVRAISFTGSSEVGRIIGESCARAFKRCSLELGGKNPMIVLDDANLELALEGALWGAFGTAGQRCTATSRIILQKGVYKRFVDELVRRSKALRLGNGLDESVDVGPVISEQQMKTVLGYVEIGKGEGARLACGGNRVDGGEYAHVKYGLSSALYTKDVNRAFAAIRDLEAGITYINAPTIGAEVHLPFGGVKQTGNGHREGGVGAFDFYTEWKAVYVDYSDRLQKAQIDRPE